MLQSMYAQLFMGLRKRISEKCPEIKWIDLETGQLEHWEVRPPVNFPCVLIDFPNTTYDQEGSQIQFGTATIQIRLGFAPFSQSNNVAPQPTVEKSIQFFELELRLYQALQGWFGVDNDQKPLCQPLTRTTDQTEDRNDPIRVRQMIFTTAFEDDSAKPVKQRVPRPQLNLE